jgi:hypothetical protein
MFSESFVLANGALVATQAALVVLPGHGVPAPIQRLHAHGAALVAPACVAAFVLAAALGPAVATGLSRLALIAVPLLAAAALGWAARGARPGLAVIALPLLALAVGRAGELSGDAAAAALSALSCVTLGRLLAGAVPVIWLKAGLVAMAVYDAVSVFGSTSRSPDATVDRALPAVGLPRFQVLDLHAALLGYADVFVAALLGAILAAELRRQWPVALLVLGLSVAFDALFAAFATLPATVPVAVALLLAEAARRAPAPRDAPWPGIIGPQASLRAAPPDQGAAAPRRGRGA